MEKKTKISHDAISPDEVVEEIVDNYLTFDSYYKLNKN